MSRLVYSDLAKDEMDDYEPDIFLQGFVVVRLSEIYMNQYMLWSTAHIAGNFCKEYIFAYVTTTLV